MAQSGPNNKVEAAADSGAQSRAEMDGDADTAANFQEFLRRYAPSTAGEDKYDILQDRYRIELSTPLPEFDSKTAKAFAATDLVQPGVQLFAQVCALGTYQRHRAVQALKPISHPHILQMVAAGGVELSRPNEERFVIFYERPTGKKLSDALLQEPKFRNQAFLCERVIAPLASAINQFYELDISHGSLNPDNIYFTDHATLGPCLSEPCGYTQPFTYEPIERIQARPAAKGEGTTAQDFYALAVLVLYIIHAPKHFEGWTEESLARSILKEGVYNALTRQKDCPEMFYDFFRGLLTQNSEDRWNYRQLKPWLEGKRYNVLTPPAPIEAVRPFDYGDTQANTRRELAHLFATDWDHMAEPVQNGKLTHWVSVSLRNKELAETVVRISRIVAELGVKNEMQLNEQLMRIILLLDPKGPIRIKHLSLNIDGIDSLALELYASKSQQEIQILAKFIEYNMTNYWLELQRKGIEYTIPTAVNNILIRLERLRTTIRNNGLGFGLERMLYDLNPDMPCLSPIFANAYVTTLPALLKKLDRLATSKAKDEDPMDRHIAAFITSKLGIQNEVRLHDLSGIPALANNRAIVALYLLAQAQQRVGNMQLPGLTHWLCLRILPTLESIHSRTLRQRLKSLLKEQAQAGYTQLLAELIISAEYATTDQAGFSQAWNLFQSNAAKIEMYRRSHHIDQQSMRLGFTLAKICAYVALMVSAASAFGGVH